MQTFEKYLELHEDVFNQIDASEVNKFVETIEIVLNRDGILWTAGNGGSASTASHAQCDLSKGVYSSINLPARVVCLNEMMATTTAWSNDVSYEEAILKMCKNYIRNNDGLLLISGSGNSKNIINALMYAKEIGVTVFGLSGFDGGKLYELADVAINVPSTDMQVVENTHLILVHWIFKNMIRPKI
jgi:D-sedoheptulose 7-phosphate isomerase